MITIDRIKNLNRKKVFNYIKKNKKPKIVIGFALAFLIIIIVIANGNVGKLTYGEFEKEVTKYIDQGGSVYITLPDSKEEVIITSKTYYNGKDKSRINNPTYDDIVKKSEELGINDAINGSASHLVHKNDFNENEKGAFLITNNGDYKKMNYMEVVTEITRLKKEKDFGKGYLEFKYENGSKIYFIESLKGTIIVEMIK